MAFQTGQKKFCFFPYLNEILDESDLQMSVVILEVMKLHVSILSEEISRYFPNLQEFDKLYRFKTISNWTICLHLTFKFKNSLLIRLMMEMQKIFTKKCVAVTSGAQPCLDLAKMALKVLIHRWAS